MRTQFFSNILLWDTATWSFTNNDNNRAGLSKDFSAIFREDFFPSLNVILLYFILLCSICGRKACKIDPEHSVQDWQKKFNL